MYRALGAAHLLTHYHHCQEGTMRERERDGGRERRRVSFIQTNLKDSQHLEITFLTFCVTLKE